MNPPSTAPKPPVATHSVEAVDALRDGLIAALRTVYDPEIPVNIYDLGLVYALDVDALGRVAVDMTLTAPACPIADTLPELVEQCLSEVPGVSEVQVRLVWDPPWSAERIPTEIKVQLGLV